MVRGSLFFVRPQDSTIDATGALSQSFIEFVNPNSVIAIFIASLLVFIQGVLINFIVANFRISNEVSLLPGLFYILLSSFIPEFLVLSPVLIANLFLILALLELFSIYKKYQVSGSIFNLGFWLGLASLFHTPNLFFILLAFVGVGLLKAFSLKERIIVLLGSASVFFLTGVFFFWRNELHDFMQLQFVQSFGFLDLDNLSGWSYKIKLIFFALLLLLAIFSFSAYMFKKKIQSQKYINILYWYLLIAGVSTLFVSSLDLTQLLILTPALGIMLSFNFQRLSIPLSESLHFVLLCLLALAHFETSWFV